MADNTKESPGPPSPSPLIEASAGQAPGGDAGSSRDLDALLDLSAALEPIGAAAEQELAQAMAREMAPAPLTEVTETTPTGLPAASPQPDLVAQLRKKVEQKDADIAKVMDAYRKLKEENESSRQRIEQVQKRHFEQSKNDFIARFVEVLDNLDRAIDAIENNFDPDAVLQGIIMVRSRLVALLREEGLEKIFVGGQAFDPEHSEAAGIEPVEDQEQDNVVLREVQRGYYLKGALLRPSRVIVGRFQNRGDGSAKPEEST